MRNKHTKKVMIVLCIIVGICICMIVFDRNEVYKIESSLIYEGPFNDDEFVQILVATDKDLEKYLKSYDIDADMQGIDFSREKVFICSMHEVYEFSYNTKNTKRNGLEILDVTFNQESEDKIYIYILKKDNIICWEASGAYKEDEFR